MSDREAGAAHARPPTSTPRPGTEGEGRCKADGAAGSLDAWRTCAVVPTYDNPETIRGVVERIRQHLPDVIVVDDGSGEAGRRACEAIAREGLATVIHLPANRGKGAAVRTGLAAARAAGFGYGLQIDGDGQHDIDQIPAFLEAGRRTPGGVVLAYPVYGETAPAVRRIARRFTHFWVDREVGGSGVIVDSMIGFRLYPVDATLALDLRCDRMAFDVESAVRLVWAGVPVTNLPVGVRYLSEEEGGRSHFRLVRDNLGLSLLHCRLCWKRSMDWSLRQLARPFRALVGRRAASRTQASGAPPAAASAASPADAEEAPTTWLSQRERGAVLGLELATYWTARLGRRPMRPLLHAIAAYYVLFDRTSRRASRDWFRRAHGREARLTDVYRHIFQFAQVTMDRLFFARGQLDELEIHRTGNQHLEALARQGQGAILLGAHLGSFDAMRAASQSESFPVTIVGHFENARMINAVLERIDPEMPSQVVHIGRDPVQLALTLQDRLSKGGMVALLADRVGLNDKCIEVDFMGGRASFATGPFLLASILKCPIYLVFGLYFEPNRYELFCEPFADKVVLPRGDREEALRKHATRYAERLEDYARRAPNNWFNFFDFWGKPRQ